MTTSHWFSFYDFFIFRTENKMTCSCTARYTCRGNCILKEIKNRPEQNAKRSYSQLLQKSFQRCVSKKQAKRMSREEIAIELTTYAYKHKCCTHNCIHYLVLKFNIDLVTKAVHNARQHVYHTNANHAHVELRDLLKTCLCPVSKKVNTYFDHMKAFSTIPNTPLLIKVRKVIKILLKLQNVPS